jgi:hypothetical protein
VESGKTHTNQCLVPDTAVIHNSNTRNVFYVLQNVKDILSDVNGFCAFFCEKLCGTSRSRRGTGDHSARRPLEGPISPFLAGRWVPRIGWQSKESVGGAAPGAFSEMDPTEWTIESASGINMRNNCELGGWFVGR